MNVEEGKTKTSLWRWFTVERLLNLLVSGLVFGIVGLLFNLWQIKQSQVQDQKIQHILSGISTQYIAQFPDDLDNANALITGAVEGDEVNIVVDFPGYGHYSCPGKFRDYLTSIKKAAARGVHIQMLVYSASAAQGDFQSQFSNDDFGKIFPPQPRNQSVFRNDCMTEDDEYKGARYLNTYEDDLKACGFQGRPASNVQFVDMLLCTNNRLCKKLRGFDVEVRTLKEANFQKADKVFLWLRGGKDRQLIINYPDFTHVGRGTSFRTTDERLLNIFHNRFQEAWEKNKPDQQAVSDGNTSCYPAAITPAQATSRAAQH